MKHYEFFMLFPVLFTDIPLVLDIAVEINLICLTNLTKYLFIFSEQDMSEEVPAN